MNEGMLKDTASLRAFLRGRLWTAGLVSASLSSAAWMTASRLVARGLSIAEERPSQVSLWQEWLLLDAEADARIASPSLRRASRTQGRQLLRSCSIAWPSLLLDGLNAAMLNGPHYPVVLGACAVVVGLDMDDAAVMATYASVSGPGFAALRLLALDPTQVVSVLAELTEDIDRVAAIAVDAVKRDAVGGEIESGRWFRLPALASPWLDFYAEAHAEMEVRLFAS